VRNLHIFYDGMQYAMDMLWQDDVPFLHLMHDSVDSACNGG